MKKPKLDNAEGYEGSISSTRRIRNSKKPSRTRLRSGNISGSCCPLYYYEKLWEWWIRQLRQNLRVFWKLMNLRESVWRIRYRIIMRTILQLQFGSQIYSYASSYEILAAKAAVDKEWENWRKIRRGPDESQKQERGDR